MTMTAHRIMNFTGLSTHHHRSFLPRNQHLYLFDIFLASQGLSPMFPIQTLVFRLKSIDLDMIILILIPIALLLFIDLAQELIQLANYVLLNVSFAESKGFLQICFCLDGVVYSGQQVLGGLGRILIGQIIHSSTLVLIFSLVSDISGFFSIHNILWLHKISILMDIQWLSERFPDHEAIFLLFELTMSMIGMQVGKLAFGEVFFQDGLSQLVIFVSPLVLVLGFQYDLQIGRDFMYEGFDDLVLLVVEEGLLVLHISVLVLDEGIGMFSIVPEPLKKLTRIFLLQIVHILLIQSIEVKGRIIFENLFFPLVVLFYLVKHILQTLVLQHETKVFKLSRPFVYDFIGSLDLYVFSSDSTRGQTLEGLFLQLKGVELVQKLRHVKVGLQTREILHQVIHLLFSIIGMQFLFVKLLFAIFLCKVFRRRMGNCILPLLHNLFNQFKELFIGHPLEQNLFNSRKVHNRDNRDNRDNR